MDYYKNSEILKALAHPVRLRIIEGLLEHDECHVNIMVEQMNIAQSTVSQHLKVLKSQGIIEPRKNGVKTCYKVIDERANKILDIFRK